MQYQRVNVVVNKQDDSANFEIMRFVVFGGFMICIRIGEKMTKVEIDAEVS